MIRVVGNVFTALTLIVFQAVVSSSQSPSQSPQEVQDQTPLKLGTELVVVDTQIVNKKTALAVGNLKKEDFTVFEDSVRQEITHFSQDQLPLSILLLLDTSGSVWDFINEVRERAVEAFGHLKDADEIALMGTASRTALIEDFTTNRKLIAQRIAAIDKKALGRNGILLHEAIYQAAKHLNKAANPASRRVIIVVTDNISTQMIGRGHSEKEALDEVYETGVAVCGLKVNDLDAMVLKLNPAYYGLKGLLFRGDINAYAEKTGGMVLKSDKSELDKKLTELIDALRTRYAIGYVSTNTKQDGKFRKIKIKVSSAIEKREGDVSVITRRGYYARKGENQQEQLDLQKPNDRKKP
jgi:VWFA-related protein